MEPLVSIIVPVYNVEVYLPHCLRAISEQTYKNLEIILVDDGSTDSSGVLCDDFAVEDSRAKVIHQENRGLWAARNAGHDAADGDFLFFPDADDYFSRDMVRILLNAINSGDGYDLALCRMKKTDVLDEDVSPQLEVSMKEIGMEELFNNLFERNTDNPFSVFMWNKLFRRSLIDGFKSNCYARSQDLDYMMRLFPRVDKAILVDNKLYYWVQHKDSLTHSRNNLKICNECWVRMYYRDYRDMPETGEKFSHYLLEALYVRILFWRDQSWSSPNREEVFSESRAIVRDTRKAFLRCRQVPLWKRAMCYALSLSPGLTHILIKVSAN